jgi:hypothetical protein
MANTSGRNTGSSRHARRGQSFDESMLPTDNASTAMHTATAVRAGPIVDHKLVFVGFDFPHADDAQGEPMHAPDSLLTVAQARDLVEQLRVALAVLRKPPAP